MINKLDADAYIRACRRIEKSAGWKYGTQRFIINRLSEISRLEKAVQRGRYKPESGKSFVSVENGKRRLIKSLAPVDAVCQHALTDEVLTPALRRYLIYDNGAGLKGRGISFTRRRFEEHIRWFYRRHGRNGYLLKIDFRKYFDNIRHDRVEEMVADRIKDPMIISLLHSILDSYKVDISYSDDAEISNEVFNSIEYAKIPKEKLVGKRYMRKSLGIGSPISQIIGVFFPIYIDYWCKNVKHVHCYDVYMDDRAVISDDKRFLKDLLEEISQIASDFGIHINRKKTQIVKLTHGFTWLKTRYQITETGKIIRKMPRDVIVSERRKLKKLATKAENGEIPWRVVGEQYRSWRGGKEWYNAYHTLHNMDLLFKELLENGRKAKRNHGKTGAD